MSKGIAKFIILQYKTEKQSLPKEQQYFYFKLFIINLINRSKGQRIFVWESYDRFVFSSQERFCKLQIQSIKSNDDV